MSDIELKPCPFCGGKPYFVQMGDNRMSTIIACEDCGVIHECGETFNHGHRWNTRHESSKVERIREYVQQNLSIAHITGSVRELNTYTSIRNFIDSLDD